MYRAGQTDYGLYNYQNVDLPKSADGQWLPGCHSVKSRLGLRHLLVSAKRPKKQETKQWIKFITAELNPESLRERHTNWYSN
jgi:hypothetical protein